MSAPLPKDAPAQYVYSRIRRQFAPDCPEKLCDYCGYTNRIVRYYHEDILTGPAVLCRSCYRELKRIEHQNRIEEREEQHYQRDKKLERNRRRLIKHGTTVQLELLAWHNGDEPQPELTPGIALRQPADECTICRHSLNNRDWLESTATRICIDCFEELNDLDEFTVTPQWIAANNDTFAEDWNYWHHK